MEEKLDIKDFCAKDIVVDMARELGIDYEETHHECCFNLPESLGSGYIKSYQFDFGLGVVETDYLLKEPLEISLKKGVVHPLKVIFNREESFEHGFEDTEKLHEVRHLENLIVASTSKNNHRFRIPAHVPICIFSLEINRKLFEEKIKDFLPEMNEDLIELFRDVNGIQTFYYKNYYSLEIAKFIEEFMSCEQEGFMKKVYQEGKAYEILTHQLKQYLDDLNEPDNRIILRQATIEGIEEASSIIQEELENVDTIINLAKRVGLNQNTLQNGFQQLYKTSVNEYIRNFRVEKAKELLETTQLNITEITYKVGINSRSYFSKLFKEKYGVAPKHYLEQRRNSSKDTKTA